MFRLRRAGEGALLEGSSLATRAIALIGLAGEDDAVQASVLAGHGVRDVCGAPRQRRARAREPRRCGAHPLGRPRRRLPGTRGMAERLLALRPAEAAHPTVEVAWSAGRAVRRPRAPVGHLRTPGPPADRRPSSPAPASSLTIYGGPAAGLPRARLLLRRPRLPDPRPRALRRAVRRRARRATPPRAAPRRSVARQGPAGQWWWHYDRRTGRVVERYPVYAVHQDAMAPMALLALERRGAASTCATPIARGLAWLARAPGARRRLADRRERRT